MRACPQERVIELPHLRDGYARLRVAQDEATRAMRDSLVRCGQLTAVVAHPIPDEGSAVEVVDGFKRLRAARELGWSELRVRVLAVDNIAAAKAAIWLLNDGRHLCELEEAWLIRSLYRDDKLTQPQIGRLLCRDKSWVCRRLMLAEALDETVQADVRLGLLAARSAEALARLPRVNQRSAADGVMRRGLTQPQTEHLVAEVLARPQSERAAAITAALERTPAGGDSGRRPRRSEGQWLLADVVALTRIAGRVQARLLGGRAAEGADPAWQLLDAGLRELSPVLAALGSTIDTVTGGRRHAAVGDSSRA
jgi:ParB-like chromosome segregation protein Spo0J